MTTSSFEISSSNMNMCECYKKLNALGIPLLITEENDEYSEISEVYAFETAFRLHHYIKINEKIKSYPEVELLDLPTVFVKMAKIIPCFSDYETNLVSFWALDIFIEALKTFQANDFSHKHQKIGLLWIAYLFNYMKKMNPTRKDFFRHLKIAVIFPDHLDSNEDYEKIEEDENKNWDRAHHRPLDKARLKVYFGSDSTVPDTTYYILKYPPEIKDIEINPELSSNEGISIITGSYSEEIENLVEPEEELNPATSETNLYHMQVILEVIYRIFARLWVNLEILDTFFAMPEVQTVELPFNLNLPKLKLSDSKMDILGRKTSLESRGEGEEDKNEFILPLQASEEARPGASGHSKASASVKSGHGKEKTKKMSRNKEQN